MPAVLAESVRLMWSGGGNARWDSTVDGEAGIEVYFVRVSGLVSPSAVVRDVGEAAGLPGKNDPHPEVPEALCVARRMVAALTSTTFLVVCEYQSNRAFTGGPRALTQFYPQEPVEMKVPNFVRTDVNPGAPAAYRFEFKPQDGRRASMLRIETRFSLLTPGDVQRALAENLNMLYEFDGIPHLLVGASAIGDPSGYIRIDTRFFTLGPLAPVPANLSGSVGVSIPGLGFLEEYDYQPAGPTPGSVPIITVRAPQDIYQPGSNLPWLE